MADAVIVYAIPRRDLEDWRALGWRLRYLFRADTMSGNGAIVEGPRGLAVPDCFAGAVEYR